MKLAYLDPHPVPGRVTEALQIMQMIDAFGRCGADVTMVSPKPPQPQSAEQILGHRLSERVQFYPLPNPRNHWWFPSGSNRPFFWLARRFLQTIEVDALFVRNLKLAAYLLRQKSLRLPPLFFDTHELFANTYREENPHFSWSQTAKWHRLVRTESLVYQEAAGLVCTTPHLLADIHNAYPITTPCRAFSLGYDAHGIEPSAIQPGTPVNAPAVLLFLGSLHPWKGVETLLKAMVTVEGAVLKIVGGEEQRHRELQQLAKVLGVENKIVWFKAVPPAQRFEVIRAADICLLPLSKRTIASRYTSPLKLFEYMAMGKAIVATDLPSIRLLLEHDTHALLAEAENPASFAQAIRSLLDDRQRAQKLATAAQEHAKNYTWEKRAEDILSFIRATRRG